MRKDHILIVDDDEAILETFSILLEEEGYRVTKATSGEEAMEKVRAEYYDMALLDIRLQDMEGTMLLSQLKDIAPETVMIMVTGYPSVQNAIEALNLGAEGYIMKPPVPGELLLTVGEKLEARRQSESITKDKLADFVRRRTLRESASFEDFLEAISGDLSRYGLTMTQAKIIIALSGLGVASASEVAALAGVRREEVYRNMPRLDRQGLVVTKLESPRKFSVVPMEEVVGILFRRRLAEVEEEIDGLRRGQAELIYKLKTIELPLLQGESSIDVVPSRGRGDYGALFVKLLEMVGKAERTIDVVAPSDVLRFGYMNYLEDVEASLAGDVVIRVLTEGGEQDDHKDEILETASTGELRYMKQADELPFNLVVVDGAEAIWGSFGYTDEGERILWSNSSTQIAIIKAAFESMWHSASP